MLKDAFGTPLEFGFKASGDWKPKEIRSPYIRLSWRQLCDAIPYIFRFFCYWLKKFRHPESIFINSFHPLPIFPFFGVPCGGIGSGCVGRDFRGAFCKFTMRPGLVEYNVVNVPENQFIVNIRRGGKTVYQQVLTAVPQKHGKLKAWRFNFPPQNLHYTGLFPRSWTVYDIPEEKVRLCCRQVSPVFPHDYKDTSLPVTIFHWTCENLGKESADVSICFTFRNGTGDPRWQKEGVCSAATISFDKVDAGIELQHGIDGMQCSYGLAAKGQPEMKISFGTFDVTKNGSDLWDQLSLFGNLNNLVQFVDYAVSAELGIALCCSTTVEPMKQCTMKTCLTWHMPEVWFDNKARTYKRRYTKWFNSASNLCKYALENVDTWEGKIDDWQTDLTSQRLLVNTGNMPTSPVTSELNFPKNYHNALMNELYYLVDGGTVWFEYDENWRLDEKHLSDYSCNLMKEYGRFAYLESFEYKMYTTYDVHFYSSFAFACLFPRIQQCIQAEYCDQIENEDGRIIRFFYSGDKGFSKQKFRVPHDLGCPGCEPWLKINSYIAHNTANWKDLNLKFVLTSMRDYFMLKNVEERKIFLQHVWPSVKILIDVALREWDSDGDCMIENSGTCDQTYDTWKMSGTSAYCGSLWLGALKCGMEMAGLMGELKTQKHYENLLEKASLAFQKKLWTGDYYRFDEKSVDNNAVMADQLCGYWYLCACGLQEKVLDENQVKTALLKIYHHCVLQFGAGKLGAVNGKYPLGFPDRTSMQAEEAWTGVTYALSALMIDQGMVTEGFSIAANLHQAISGSLGMQFQSPEAIYENKYYRALGYMRAMSIWSIFWMLNRKSLTMID